MRYTAWNNNLLIAELTTFTADSLTTAYPVSNLLSHFVAQPWRTTGATDVSLNIDLGAAKSRWSLDLLALSGLNVGTTGVITWTAGASTTATDINQTLTYRKFDQYKRLSAGESWRFHRVRIQDPGNPDGFIQVGMVWLGTAKDSPIQFGQEWEDSDRVINREQATEVGIIHSELLARQVQLEITFAGLTKTQRDTVWDEIVIESNGSELPLFIIPKDDEYEGYTLHVAAAESSHKPGMLEVNLRMVEAIRGIAVGS